MSFRQTSFIPDGFDWEAKKQKEVVKIEVAEEPNNDSKNKRRSKRKLEEPPDEERHLGVANAFDPASADFLNLETIDECERLVLAYPNSSKAWLLYMVFHLKQAEIEKARIVAQKALKAINFREEQEKLNVWIAYLNLENLYGTEQSLKSVFKEALCYNDAKKIYGHLVDILLKYNKVEEAEETFSSMIKKFKDDKNIWIKFMSFYMKSGKPELARNILEKSLKNLHKTCHAEVTMRFAQMEYEDGDLERCKVLFENLIRDYPKRKDILSLYISILNKSGNTKEASRLSECLKVR